MIGGTSDARLGSDAGEGPIVGQVSDAGLGSDPGRGSNAGEGLLLD